MTSPTGPPSLRADKWLWATRIFKSRSLAAEACLANHVKRAGIAIKPATLLRAGDQIEVTARGLTRTLHILDLPTRRLGAPLAAACYDDLTPPEQPAARREARRSQDASRPDGAGRPSKLERREIERVKAWLRDDGVI